MGVRTRESRIQTIEGFAAAKAPASESGRYKRKKKKDDGINPPLQKPKYVAAAYRVRERGKLEELEFELGQF